MIRSKISILTVISSLAFGLSLSACNGSKSSSTDISGPINNPEPLAGIWQAPAYGLLLNIQADSHQFYQVTADFCQTIDLNVTQSDLLINTQLMEDNNSIATSLSGLKVPRIIMSKENNLPDVCVNDLIANSGESNYQFDAQRDFEIFWQTFNQHYGFFAIEGVDWDATFQIANSQIGPNTNQNDLLEILIEMVEPLRDFNVRIVNEDSNVNFSVFRKPSLIDLAVQDFVVTQQIELPFNQTQLNAFNDYFDSAIDQSIDAIVSNLVTDSDFKESANGNIFYGMFEGNIGYVNFLTMELVDFGNSTNNVEQNKAMLAETLDEVMEYFADAQGLIIDLRYLGRGVGDGLVSSMIVSRFIDQPLHVYSQQTRLADGRTPVQQVIAEPEGGRAFLGSIALMTSETTSGAGEIFAMSMRQRANTTLIGEASAGGFSDKLIRTLPNGTEYSLSNEYLLTPANEEFEGVGVPVDIEQAFFTREQREQGVDLGLEKAKEWFTQ